ncbi:hypothetical protein K438DRAFT_1787841 [Mycena galopus ATCC 62051]|nr:hypothetical protein K438DRAFT_1787841 [Mycena galopus ATCC 62051]
MPIRQKAKREGLKMQKKEDKIQDAVVGIQSGRFKNPREAADELGIPKQASTIRRRLNGTSRPRIESQIDRQLLTPIGQMGSHQTHKEQPCDVGAFGPSKNNWRIRCDEVLHETGEDIPVSDIVKEWMFVREKSFKVETIKQAWFKSGINLDASGLFPRLTPDIFTDADFAPSISTSTQLHLPATFPPLPSSEGDDRDSLSPAGEASGAASGSSSSSAASTSASASTSSSLPFSLPTLSYEYPDSDDDEPPSDLEGPALLEFYRAAAVKAKAQRNEARAQREGADAHAVMAGLHAQSLQQKLAAKGKKRSGNDRTLSTKARMLTSAEGRELAEQRRTAQIDKQTKQDDNRTQKLLADAEVIKRRAELGRAGMEFTGTIKQLKLPQLKDLAWSLELEESGTREVLIERILAHFAANEELKKDKRYLELWTRRRRAAGASAEEPQDPQPLMDIQNTAGGSSQMDVDIPPPDAQYSFPDDWIPLHSSTSYPSPAPGFTWIPPPSHHPYNPQTGQPPPFSPAFYGNLPPSDFSSARHPYGRF